MATQPNGISALQLHRQLAFGSGVAALRQTAPQHARPGRSPLAGLVESRVDETEIACRSKNDPSPVVADAVIRAKCWWSAPSRSKMAAAALAVSGSAKFADYSIIRPPACMALSH
jgi:hypothetical protein